jgi:hypothetical protein
MGHRPLKQMGRKGFDHVQGAVEIDVHGALDLLVVQVIDLDEGLDDTRVVDEAVDPAVAVDHLLGKGLHLLTIADIQLGHGQVLLLGAYHLGGLFHASQVDVGDGHFSALGQEQAGQLAAHTTTGSGYHDHFLLYVHGEKN